MALSSAYTPTSPRCTVGWWLSGAVVDVELCLLCAAAAAAAVCGVADDAMPPFILFDEWMTFVVVVNGNDEVWEESEEPSALESPMTTEERRVCGPGAIREEEAERRQEGVEAVDRDDRKERCSERKETTEARINHKEEWWRS